MPVSPPTDAPTAAFPFRISFGEAVSIVDAVADERRLQPQTLSLSRAHGHVLARDVIATMAQPPFDNSAMDGFALRHEDLSPEGAPTRLRLAGEQFAGPDAALVVEAGTCVRITTGAPMPSGADTVVMKENTSLEGDTVSVQVAPRPGQHVRRAGEDSNIGDLLLRAGDVLTPARSRRSWSRACRSVPDRSTTRTAIS